MLISYRLPCIIFFVALPLFLHSCKEKAGHATAVAAEAGQAEERLFRALIDTALGFNNDAFLRRLDSTLPRAAKDNYRLQGYRLFLQGYMAYKKKQPDTAASLFGQMLKNIRVDTSRDRDLLTLKRSGLFRLKLESSVNSSTFAFLFPILDMNERYPSRYRWWTYDLAAEAWFRFPELSQAEHYIDMTCSALPDTLDYSLRALILSRYSRVQSARGNFKKAMVYEDSVFKLASMANDKKMQAVSKAALGVLYIKTGDRKKGYALQFEAFELKKQLHTDLPREYLNMANTFLDEKEYNTSLDYARQGLALAKKEADLADIGDAHETIAGAYLNLKQYDSAFLYLANACNANMQAMADAQNKEVAAMQISYDLKRQSQQTTQLRLENKAQSTILKQQRILLFAFAALLLLVLLLAFVFMRQRRLKALNESMELEQRLLRSQMDPHFIFNTLSALQSFIRNRENDKSIIYLNQFARLLRVSLENSREPFVPLQKEIEALKNYMSLQYMRFEDRFDYHIGLYEGYDEDEILIPPMLLQPFVENAIQHGMQELGSKGHIDINILKEDGMLRCSIEDNGPGMQTEKTGDGRQSLSTFITKERLEILSKKTGKKAGLLITDKTKVGTGKGVLVQLDIPYTQASQEAP